MRIPKRVLNYFSLPSVVVLSILISFTSGSKNRVIACSVVVGNNVVDNSLLGVGSRVVVVVGVVVAIVGKGEGFVVGTVVDKVVEGVVGTKNKII